MKHYFVLALLVILSNRAESAPKIYPKSKIGGPVLTSNTSAVAVADEAQDVEEELKPTDNICDEAGDERSKKRQKAIEKMLSSHYSDPGFVGPYAEFQAKFKKAATQFSEFNGTKLQAKAKELCDQKEAIGKKVNSTVDSKELEKGSNGQCDAYDTALKPLEAASAGYVPYWQALSAQQRLVNINVRNLVNLQEREYIEKMVELRTKSENAKWSEQVNPLVKRLYAERKKAGNLKNIAYHESLRKEKSRIADLQFAYADKIQELTDLKDKCVGSGGTLRKKISEEARAMNASQKDTSAANQKEHYAVLKKFAEERGLKLPKGCLRGVYGNCANHVAAMMQVYHGGNTSLFDSYKNQLETGQVKVGVKKFTVAP